jgi:SAM-dependent methyltransferase
MKFRIPDYPKRILDIPVIYTLFQSVVGYSEFASDTVSTLVSKNKGESIIDLGCGPCDLLSDVKLVSHYFGIDIHGPFIERAKILFPPHANNLYEASIIDFDYASLEIKSKSVIVLALGLLHHLSDTDIIQTMNAIKKLNRKIVVFSIDPVFFEGQNIWSRFLANSDRGRYVRKDTALISLMNDQGFLPEEIKIDNKALNTRMHLLVATWTYVPS